MRSPLNDNVPEERMKYLYSSQGIFLDNKIMSTELCSHTYIRSHIGISNFDWIPIEYVRGL